MRVKVHVMWRGMWRPVYRADDWSLAAHAIVFLLAFCAGAALWRL